MKKRRLIGAGLAVPPLIAAAVLVWNSIFGSILAPLPFSTAFMDRDGTLLHVFLNREERYRMRSPLADYPPELIEAVLLQEDQFFYGHHGINIPALFRAGWQTYIKRERRVGASTISMQTARLRFKLETHRLPGKIIQIAAALFLETCFSKQEILEAWMNLAPMGGNIEGFTAASWFYFGCHPRDLTTGEMLMLAVIPQNPVRRGPLQGVVPAELLDARSSLYQRWVTARPADALIGSEMSMAPAVQARFPRRALHHSEFLALDPAAKGHTQRTTIDHRLQSLCEDHLSAYIGRNRTWGVSNGSILLIDHTTMEVLAAVGSADWYNDSIQGMVNGTTARRSPGSTLKPFIYALALEQGLIHPETMLRDTPQSFNEYTPDNYQSDYKGPVKAWDALADSRNIPAVHLANRLENPDLWDLLHKAGIRGLRSREHYGLSIVLGSAELTMMELVQLYAALPGKGFFRPLQFYPSAQRAFRNTRNASVPVPAPSSGSRLFSEEAAWVTLRMMERNPPPERVRPDTSTGVPVGWKTGTSIGFKDSWSVAVFDRYVLVVWIGNFSGEGNTAFIGRLMAAPLQFGIIDALLAATPEETRLKPESPPYGVSAVPVCSVSGGIPSPDCPTLVNTWFIPGVSPITPCSIHRRVHIDTRTGWRTEETAGPHIRSEVREFWPSDLARLFEQAGLPRLAPPPWPEDLDRLSRRAEGWPPFILSPLNNTTYVIPPDADKYRQLVLEASADAETTELFWFANSAFLGRSKPQELLLWKGENGSWDITVVDSLGRSATVRITITSGNTGEN